MDLLFPFSEYWGLYIGFTAFVLGVLALDLGVFHKDDHVVTFKEALSWSMVWVTLAFLFNFALWKYAAWEFAQNPRLLAIPGFNPQLAANQAALEFLTGYVVEKSLAVDNIFVFIVVFSYFAVPAKYQHRVLFYGIIGALALRAGFIALGSILMRYEWVVIFFGVFLGFTGVKILFAPDKPVDPSKNFAIKFVRKVLPVTDTYHGHDFFVKQGGRLVATPLLLCLIFVEVSDIIFAVDSVPAIFAITKEPFIVYTSNIFAVLGLRAMFSMLAGVMDKFYLLKFGLGIVLIFVGLKMAWLNEAFGGKFPISWSLGVIGGVITTSIVASLLLPKKATD